MKLHLVTLALALTCSTLASSQTCGRPSSISNLLSSLLPSSTQFTTNGLSPGISPSFSPAYSQEFIVQGPSYAVPNIPFVPRQIPVVPNSQVLQSGQPLLANAGYQLGTQGPVLAGRPCGNVPPSAPVIANLPTRSSCGCSAPAGLISPYLPTQSPVSALAPTTSNCLPAMAPTGSRCNYLRQIPIPPPSC